MRHYLAIIFIIIFSFQVLPVRVIGKLLVKGQTEEEVKHGDCGDDANGKTANYNDLINHSTYVFAPYNYPVQNVGFVVHKADDLPASIVTEIPCPPPNC